MAPLYLLILILLQSHPSTADFLAQMCDTSANYTTNSTFQSNLNLLLTSLSSSNSSFSTGAKGSLLDSAYGLALCRGDASPSDCRTCLEDATQNILQVCPYNKQAIVWYDNCLVRYSNIRFFSSVDNKVVELMANTQNATDPDRFSKLVRDLIERISNRAAYNSSLMFATGKELYAADSSPIYALVQCTRDLSTAGCSLCLQDILGFFDRIEDKQGGRVLGKSCNFRYEVYSFYAGEPTISLALSPVSPPTLPPLSPPTGEAGNNNNNNNNIGKVLKIVIPLAIALVLTFTICICFWRRSRETIPGVARREEISSVESLLLDLSILKVATANFSHVNKLGEGGFGTVYKGTLPDGQEIAVKRLSATSRQGLRELKNELVLVAKLQHKNLVRLLGVCLEEEEQLLVYEYMPNRSLDTFLFDPIKCKQLNWERRFKIIRGIARGLLYLHEGSNLKVIHRDLKASNILLDADMNPKISDFGLARLFGADETQGTTSRVVGTFGYMAPEYAMRGHFSIKLDVFSFGVLVLEIVTGIKNSSFRDSEHANDLLSYTWEHWSNGRILEMMDPSLGEHCSINEVSRCIQVGLLCAQQVPADRPRMLSVILMLNSSSVPLQAPLQPTFPAGIITMDSNVSAKPNGLGSSELSGSKSEPISASEVSISELETM